MTGDLPQGLVVVGVGRQEVEASLQEKVEMVVGCCLVVDVEVKKILVLTQLGSLRVEEGEVHASLEEHSEVWVQKMGGACSHQAMMVGPHETGSSGLVEVCWVWEGDLLECLVCN